MKKKLSARNSGRTIFRLPILVLSMAVLATGCTSTQKRTIGLTRDAPDEFDVLSRAPLSIPPDFRLAEPNPGGESLSDRRADEIPRNTVFGTDDLDARVYDASNPGPLGGQTTGERSFLGQAGAQNSTANIRQVIDGEARAVNEADDSFINKVITFGTGAQDVSSNEVLVDAQEETRRIRENRALGNDVTFGETPELDPPDRTNALQGLFDRALGR